MWDAVDAVVAQVRGKALYLDLARDKVEALMDIHLPLPARDAHNRAAVVADRGAVADYFSAAVGEIEADHFVDYREDDFEASEEVRREDLAGLR